jgi:branched-chain amino acid transport system ATP-binding protein
MLRLRGEGVTLLLVEQNARMALAVSDHVVVLGKGAVVFAGPVAEFRQREAELKGRYLSV